MKHRITLFLTAIAASMPHTVVAAPGGSVRDFRLPPAPTATSTPQVQGPIDPDAVVPNRPRAVNTPTPTPTPTPVARPTIAPRVTPTIAPTTAPTPQQRRTVPSPASTRTPNAQRTITPRPATPLQSDETVSRPSDIPAPTPDASVSIVPGVAPSVEATDNEVAPGETGDFPWLWLLGGLVILGLIAAAIFLRTRSTQNAPAPVIEPPLRKAADAAEPVVAPVPQVAKGLTMQAEAIKLSRSMMNASLAYRITVKNQTARTIANIAVGGELVSAHQGKPVDQQMADAAQSLPQRHEVSQLAPGHSESFTGILQLPVDQIAPIRQGNGALYVPLMRWRVASAEGAEPVAKTYVVGQRATRTGGKMQPFPLDRELRSFDRLSQRALD